MKKIELFLACLTLAIMCACTVAGPVGRQETDAERFFDTSNVPTQAPTKASMEMLATLQRIEAHCETGITYIEYESMLGDAVFQMRQYVQLPEAQLPGAQFPQTSLAQVRFTSLTRHVINALAAYNAAGKIWKEGIDAGMTSLPYGVQSCWNKVSSELRRAEQLLPKVVQ